MKMIKFFQCFPARLPFYLFPAFKMKSICISMPNPIVICADVIYGQVGFGKKSVANAVALMIHVAVTVAVVAVSFSLYNLNHRMQSNWRDNRNRRTVTHGRVTRCVCVLFGGHLHLLSVINWLPAAAGLHVKWSTVCGRWPTQVHGP